MKSSSLQHIFVAILVLAFISGFSFLLKRQFENFALAFLFSIIIIAVSVSAKKITAHLLDADIEHEIWQTPHIAKQIGIKKSIPTGIVLPILISLVSLGTIKFTAFLTYETRAQKYRASKRFGFYSYKEMTDWHNGIIGASGIFFVLVLSLLAYLIPANLESLEYLAKLSAYYAFWNIIPFSKLDGTQIFFGSRILWAILAALSAIFAIFAVITV